MGFASQLMPSIEVDAESAAALRQGKRVPAGEGEETVLVFDPEGRAVCVARRAEGVLRVARGINAAEG